ncbi:regulatory protein RecX [soil metagenome]
MRRERIPPKPLDASALERLALRYVERFATTRGKLVTYLGGKIRQQGWDGPSADPVALAEKLAELGYIDDRAFAEARAGAMTRRGLGKRRVTGALRQAGVREEDAEAVMPGIEDKAIDAAMAYARKRRIGPFADSRADRVLLEKHVGALVRAGHDFGLARRIARLGPGEELEE